MKKLAAKIVEHIDRYGNGITFGELARLDGFSGEYMYGSVDHNQFFWFACSEEAIDALAFLTTERIVTFRRMSALEADMLAHTGQFMPVQPIVTEEKKYDTPHWVPVVLDKGPKFRRLDPAE